MTLQIRVIGRLCCVSSHIFSEFSGSSIYFHFKKWCYGDVGYIVKNPRWLSLPEGKEQSNSPTHSSAGCSMFRCFRF